MNPIRDEPIKFRSDYQTDWSKLIRPLIKRRYAIKAPDMLSIQGDAPKAFLSLREEAPGYVPVGRRRRRISKRRSRWRAYIAKVGSKWYPVESVTEHFITRIGQIAGLRIADSQLRIVGNQVRFLSRYFLRRGELLYHGFDLFTDLLGREIVEQIAASRDEPDLYTYQTIGEAVLGRFPEQFDRIMRDLAEMIAFDALVGNNDRHPANWGIVVEITGAKEPRFSPVFDSARALLWNTSEDDICKTLANPDKFAKYIRKTTPQIGWDGCGKVTHFDLVRGICERHPDYRPCLLKYAADDFLPKAHSVLESEFSGLMSPVRRELILKILERRHRLLLESVSIS
jgi:HipA-like C-terminal domain